MRVLVVGAGAVGQVYALCLKRGGAEVAWWVKAKYREEALAGFRLYDLRAAEPTVPIPLEGLAVHETVASLGTGWHLVVLTVSSTALAGDWLSELLGALPGVPVLVLQPGLDDVQIVREAGGERPILHGVINMISYHAPLPGETRFTQPGNAFYLPPLVGAPLAGDQIGVGKVLARGGMKISAVKALPDTMAFGAALLATLMASLEVRGWKFAALQPRKERVQAIAAVREAIRGVELRTGLKRPLPMRLLGPTLLGVALRLAPLVLPLDLETYFQVHFTKVGDQTRAHLGSFLGALQGAGEPAPVLTALLDRLPA